MFARGLLGPGVGIRPSSGSLVRAPASGRVASVARAKHAVGLTTDRGGEIVIHVGIDTVALAGQHFEVLVRTGQQVAAGEPIGFVDVAALVAEG